MAQFTIQEIYNGTKYDILNAAMKEYIEIGRPKKIGERTWLDMLLVKHTLIIAEIMNQEGDSVSTMLDRELSSSYIRWDVNYDT